MQRFLDIFFSTISIIFFSPLFIFIILLLRFTGEGEVFYLQERVGKDKNIFRLFKFVTMVKNSSNMGTGYVTVKDDPRVLPVGRFLRKTKINELPQLFNIFLGHMSVIGPRPQSKRCFDAFLKEHQEYIVKVRPGLSGIGSIIFRDEEKMLSKNEDNIDFYDNIISPYKGSLEVWYVKNKNLRKYFLLIFLTIWAVLNKKSNLHWIIYKDMPQPPTELKYFI